MITTVLSDIELFLVELLTETPPLHNSDLLRIVDLIAPNHAPLDSLRKQGYIVSRKGYRILADNPFQLTRNSRLKSAVITEAICGIVQWENTHNPGAIELTQDMILDVLIDALEAGLIPYTENYRYRQMEQVLPSLPRDLKFSEIQQMGVQVDFVDDTNKVLYLHVLDDTKDSAKCRIRNYMIKTLEALFCATAQIQVFTNEYTEAARRYSLIDRTHICPFNKSGLLVDYFTFIHGMNFFFGKTVI